MAFLVGLLTHMLRWFSGALIFISVLCSLGVGFFDFSPSMPGSLQLISGCLLLHSVPSSVKRMSLLLVVCGVAALAAAPGSDNFFAVTSRNQELISMLAAVTFLRYSPRPLITKKVPEGAPALWQTLFGLHWFASVINLSALIIFSDYLSDAQHRLSPFQGKMLSRGFSLAALWSPFFVGTAVALTYSPGADYWSLLLWGFPFSQVLLAGMIWMSIKRRSEEVNLFRGYSFSLLTLAPPLGLAIAVIIFHQVYSQFSIPAIITLLAPCYPLIANLKKGRFSIVKSYVSQDLPRMAPEIVLFVSSGVLGSGLKVLVSTLPVGLIPELSPWLLSSFGLAAILAASCLGIHPVVGVVVVSGVVSQIHFMPNLLALCFLFGWGLGVLVNPISGIHILLSSRYSYPSERAWAYNLPFVCIAYFATCILFWFVERASC